MLLKDLPHAWPPTAEPGVRPDPQDVVIRAWSQGSRFGRIGMRLRKQVKYCNQTIEYNARLLRIPEIVFWPVLRIIKNGRMTLGDIGRITIPQRLTCFIRDPSA
jgi:hypothetical protein